MRVIFSAEAWDQYTSITDRALIKKINRLIADIQRNDHDGIGNPEPLRHNLSGLWSRRITQEHRLVYRLVDQDLEIAACLYHYGK